VKQENEVDENQTSAVPSAEMKPTSELSAAHPVLVIERDRWLRGDLRNSMLLRDADGKMCCLGFDCIRRGLRSDQIRNVYTPEDLLVEEVVAPESLGDLIVSDEERLYAYRHAGAVEELMEVNDNPQMNESEREQRITELFDVLGVVVEFVDTKPDTNSVASTGTAEPDGFERI
jgi:hypothetical protein